MKILVVEDDHGMQKALTRILARFLQGSEMVVAGNGAEMEQAFRSHDRFHFVTMDGRLPHEHGLDWGPDLIVQIRTKFDPTVPILFISGEDQDMFRQAREAGATECLAKPYENEDIGLILKKWGLMPKAT